MPQEIDDKGKIFTEVVHKEPIQVTIQTRTNRIRGNLHKRSDNRMIDKLNHAEAFIPMTDVVVMDVDGKVELLRSDFLALNRSEIIWLVELGEE
ncbi:MAG: hypothetical protein M1347_01545 [Chloroflexi bacterium]|nr:hypothetical protein [Chloroflexota bacterium]